MRNAAAPAHWGPRTAANTSRNGAASAAAAAAAIFDFFLALHIAIDCSWGAQWCGPFLLSVQRLIVKQQGMRDVVCGYVAPQAVDLGGFTLEDLVGALTRPWRTQHDISLIEAWLPQVHCPVPLREPMLHRPCGAFHFISLGPGGSAGLG